jgi:restriction system protein
MRGLDGRDVCPAVGGTADSRAGTIPGRLLAASAQLPFWPPNQTDLLAMDPIDFEDLVVALFKAMGMEVMTTERSGDGVSM